jgi:hypothetical protein
MAIRFARLLGPVTALEPGEYTLETASGRPAVRCPGCGSIDEVTGTISAGRVLEAYRCETPTCSFHEWIELQGYGE